MPCTRCKSINVVLAGKYLIQRTGRLQQRFKCKDCSMYFIRKTNTYGNTKYSQKLMNKILHIYKQHKIIYKTITIKKQVKISKPNSALDVAKELGISVTGVKRILRKYNVVRTRDERNTMERIIR